MITQNPISSICKEINERRNHVMIGISPFNSYYSEERIKNLILWAHHNFKNFHLFVPDNLPVFNFLALGYTPDRAKSKTKQQWRYLRNKILRAFSSLNISTDDALLKIITTSLLENNPNYISLLEEISFHFENDIEFSKKCLDTSKVILSVYSSNESVDVASHIAAQYLIRELPLYLDTPNIIGVEESIFVYHESIKFFTDIFTYRDNHLLSKHQGHLVVQQE